MYKVLDIGDVHIPYHDIRSLEAFEEMLKDYKPDELIIHGDFLDLDQISSHNAGLLRNVEGKRIKADYLIAEAYLDEWSKHTKKITWLEGNHEYRIERWLDINPSVEGLFEIENWFQLKKLKTTYIKSWSEGKVYKIGKARFIHGTYTNQFHAKKTVENYGHNIFYGHTHDVQGYSKEVKGDNKTTVGQSMGCMCKYGQGYMKGRPNKWQQAVTEFIFLPDGHFDYYIHRIFNHKIITPNKIYG